MAVKWDAFLVRLSPETGRRLRRYVARNKRRGIGDQSLARAIERFVVEGMRREEFGS